MAEEPTTPPETPTAGPEVVLTEKQRAVFRSAGVWMMIVGWIEVAAGCVMGLGWLLSSLGFVPQPTGEVVAAPADRGTMPLQIVATIGIGVITVLAARSFVRAAKATSKSLDAVTEAVAELQDLYERQVWVFGIFVVIAVGLAVMGR